MGTHTEKQYNHSSKKNEQKQVVDFDISFSMSSYLTREDGLWQAFTSDNSDSVYRGSFRKTKAKGYRQDIEIAEGDNPNLQDWCREYCGDKSALKAFRVTREVTGLEEDFIRQGLERTIRSTHYHGHLNISFPIIEKHVDIYHDHWINRWRVGWQRWIFYLTFLVSLVCEKYRFGQVANCSIPVVAVQLADSVFRYKVLVNLYGQMAVV